LSLAVEGLIDEAVASRLASYTGFETGPVFGRRGRAAILAALPGYNSAARHTPWLVMADLDTDECAPQLVRTHLPNPSLLMRFRVPVTEVESWLLADRARMARYLAVPETAVPGDPDSLANPKQVLVNLARRSRSRRIQSLMVPAPRSRGTTGPGYTSALSEFAVRTDESGWRPDIAATASDSLDRAMRSLVSLRGQT
jgi:hypothetical protein